MKKIVAILIASTFIFSFSACGRKQTPQKEPITEAQDIQSENETPSENNFIPPPPEENGSGNLFEPYVGIISKGNYYLKYKASDEDEMTEFATNDGNIAVKSGEMSQVIEGDVIYNIMHDQKLILTAKIADAMRKNLTAIHIKTQEEMDKYFIESGQEEINGKNLRFERFSTGENTFSQYYFEDSVLKYIKNFKDDKESLMIEVIEFSESVPSDIFKIPSDYMKQDISG